MIDSTILEQDYSYFLAEAQDLLQAIEHELLLLKTDRTPARVHSLMRAAHTLKGAAASIGNESIKTIAHALEDVFKALYNPEVAIDSQLEALLFEGYECLRLPVASALAHTQWNEAELLNRADAVFIQLRTKLGSHFNPQIAIPTSVELGFDITQSLFETGVSERLEQLATVLVSNDIEAIGQTLQTQAEVFIGLAESLNLSGFRAIAQAAITALGAHPKQASTIAQLALTDFRQGHAAVLAGDRHRGGEPSAALQQLAGWTSFSHPDLPQIGAHSRLAETWERVARFLNQPIWKSGTTWQSLFTGSLFTTHQSAKLRQDPLTNTNAQVKDIDFIDFTDFNQLAIEPEDFNALENLEQSLSDVPPEFRLEERATQVDWTTNETGIAPENENDLNGDRPPVWFNPLVAGMSSHGASREETAYHRHNTTTVEPSITDSLSLPVNVRVNLKQLESLNHSVSELLINQNRQTLQDENLQILIRDLSHQLRQHQQTMIDLRDWCDRLSITSEREHRFIASKERSQPCDELPTNFDALELDRYSELHLQVQSALEEIVKLERTTESIELVAQQSNQALNKQKRFLANVRDDLMTARMIPISEVFNRFPRLLQQLISSYGKAVNLQLKGNQVLVDKAIAEKLFDPLLHLVRNAFDHGIESAETRSQQGKPEVGQIEVAAYQQGNRTVIEVKDDGQGLDLEKICQRGFELQLLPSADVDHFSEAELLNLLFEPGFSTSAQVNDLSGRGVGLDVVRSQLRALQGLVTIQSKPNQGTTFSLHLPLTLMPARLLICRVGEAVYTLLSETVETILLPDADQIEYRAHQKVFRWQQEQAESLVSIHSLSNLLQYTVPLSAFCLSRERNQSGEMMPALTTKTAPLLLLSWKTQHLALEVDEILGEQELVIRPLGNTIAPPSYVYGCSSLGDGRLTLVLDPIMLAQQRLGQEIVIETAPLPEEQNRSQSLPGSVSSTTTTVPPSATKTNLSKFQQILVVDDSVTVRQTLTRTLQKAGYQVLQAKDGQEAIDYLQQHDNIRLVTCDIEMPQLNGFEFLVHRKQEPALASIPVIMLTSRSSEKHRQLALQLGADAYMTKPYTEPDLLTTIEHLV